MKYPIFFILIAGLFFLAPQTQSENPTLLILPFNQTGQVPADLGETITDLITNQISVEKFIVIERSSMEKSLQQKIASEPLNPNHVELLKTQNITMIVVGQISKVGEKYYGGYRVIDVATSRITTNEAIRGIASVDELIESFTRSFIAKEFIQDPDYVVVKKSQLEGNKAPKDDPGYVRIKKEELEALKNANKDDDKEYIRVKRDQWEMLNKFARQTRTPLPTLVKQYEYYKTYWRQYAQQQRSYNVVIRSISQTIREMGEAQDIVSPQEQQVLQKYQRELGQILAQAQELQSRDRSEYNQLVQAVEQNSVALTAQYKQQYMSDTSHLQIMSDVAEKINYNATVAIFLSPSHGFQDPGAGPDPKLTVQLCTCRDWYRPDEWETKKTVVFTKEDIRGETEVGSLSEVFDVSTNYALKLHLLEVNAAWTKDVDFGWFDHINLTTAFFANQTMMTTKNCAGYGQMTLKVQPRSITFQAIPKFRE